MITGTHVIIYTKDAEADRALFRDMLGFENIEAHPGWLIFALPPAEMGIHPDAENGKHEIYFMCTDLDSEIESLKGKGVECSEVRDFDWGMLTMLSLPGGGKIGLYQPKHATAVKI